MRPCRCKPTQHYLGFFGILIFCTMAVDFRSIAFLTGINRPFRASRPIFRVAMLTTSFPGLMPLLRHLGAGRLASRATRNFAL